MESAVQGVDYLEKTVPSESTPGKFYHIRLWLRDWRGFKANSLSCDCPRWIYQKQPLNVKSCKHTLQYGLRLREHPIVRNVEGSEVTFDEEAVASKGISRLEALIRELEPL